MKRGKANREARVLRQNILLPDNDNAELWGDYQTPGDIHKSRWHDVFWFFIGHILTLVVIGCMAFGLAKGRLWLVTDPRDSTGRYCGHDDSDLLIADWRNTSEFVFRNQTDLPYLFFAAGRNAPYQKLGELQICVAQCPGSGDYADAIADTCGPDDRICPFGVDPSTQRVPGGACVCQWASKPLQHRCIPDLRNDTVVEEIANAMQQIPGLTAGIVQLGELWREILAAGVAAMVVSAILLVLFRFIAACIVYALVLLAPFGLIAVGVWLWFWGGHSTIFFQPSHARWTAGVIWVGALLLLCVTIFLWGRLKRSVDLVELSSTVLFESAGIYLSPVLAALTGLAFWALGLVTLALVFSTHDMVATDEGKLAFAHENPKVQLMIVFLVVWLIFISLFVYFQNYYAASSAVVARFFDTGSPDSCSRGCCACLYGYYLAWTKGFGSITLTALILTPIYPLMMFLEWLDFKKHQNGDDQCCFVRFLTQCGRCCLVCFERALRYINKTVLTIGLIYNQSWYRSVQMSIQTLAGDPVLICLMNGIVTFLLFMAKIVVATAASFVFLAYLRSTERNVHWLIPAICVFILSFLLSSFVMNVFENIAEIVMVCHLADQRSAGGRAQRLASARMRDLVDDFRRAASEDSGLGQGIGYG